MHQIFSVLSPRPSEEIEDQVRPFASHPRSPLASVCVCVCGYGATHIWGIWGVGRRRGETPGLSSPPPQLLLCGGQMACQQRIYGVLESLQPAALPEREREREREQGCCQRRSHSGRKVAVVNSARQREERGRGGNYTRTTPLQNATPSLLHPPPMLTFTFMTIPHPLLAPPSVTFRRP